MHPRLEPWLVSLVFALALFSSAVSSEAAGAAAAAERSPFEGLFTRAACDGPAGPFSTEIISLADGTCRFVQIRGDDRSEILVSGGRVHQTTDTSARLAAAPAFLEQFVRGHEVHRLLCDAPERTERGEPLELSLHEKLGGGTVRIEFSDWRPVHGIDLPFQVDFIHGQQHFTHRFTAILPFRIAPGSSLPPDPIARFERLGDLAEIAALHQRVLDAHLEGDVQGILGDESAMGTTSGRGRLATKSRDALAQSMGAYLETTHFERYEDIVIPIIAVSADGSLGWLGCEIEAAGSQQDASGEVSPLAYGFSWVELVAREDGRWRRIGNASSAR
jgi:hypothetical protein